MNKQTKASKGQRFLHKRWLDSTVTLAEHKANPHFQLCQITAIRGGMIYYRPVYCNPDRLGSTVRASQDFFQKHVVLEYK